MLELGLHLALGHPQQVDLGGRLVDPLAPAPRSRARRGARASRAGRARRRRGARAARGAARSRKCSAGISASSGQQLAVDDHAGERAALDLVGRRDDPRRRRHLRQPRSRRRGSGSASRSGRSPSARPRAGRASRDARRGTPRPRAAPASRSSAPLRLDLGAVQHVRAARRRAAPRTRAGSSAGSTPGGSATTFTSKPCAIGELHPAERRRLRRRRRRRTRARAASSAGRARGAAAR